MDETQQIGTVRILDPYSVVSEKKMPEWVVPRVPKLWNIEKKTAICSSINVRKENESTNVEQTKVPHVQSSQTNESKGQRMMVSAKRMDKLLRSGAEVYLAVILPSSIHKSGVTQKVKQQRMKEKGAIRKPPPVAETRSKMCKEAPVEVREELQELLKQYQDIFPEQLPKGKPPKRTVEFEIKTEEGATPPNKPPYRLSPKEHEELQLKSMTYSLKGTSDLPLVRMAHRSYLSPRRTAGGGCAWTTGRLIDRRFATGILCLG